ncbi:hypothetical protein DC498_16450 [Terrimonas sp.]|uniref:hypothetical protein n=1 Tax=Terrimonas sp. TaxID=1914338 RepID=UPI000D512A98|nr:hypothetical protein [Terrimonas sp.]PVD51011.1 hypothetical protein DC498_16450 [Terrimonas sp.]
MKNYIAFLLLMAAYACSNTNNNQPADEHNASVPKTASDSLYKSVMDGHDVSMKKMGEIVRLKTLISQQKDSIAGLKTKNQQNTAAFDIAFNNLVYAEELMNKWMQDFNPDNAGNSEDEKLVFFKKEKEKIDTVNARIDNSIETAKKITAARP